MCIQRVCELSKDLNRVQVAQKTLKKLTPLLNLLPRVLDFLGLDLGRRGIETAEFMGFLEGEDAGGEGLVGGGGHFVLGDGGWWGEGWGVQVGGCDL